MTHDQAKAILIEFDRLKLEIPDGLNLLTEHGMISDHVILLGQIAKADGEKCVAFLRDYEP